MEEDTLTYRVSRLEKSVDEIKNNHLEHLQKDVTCLKTDMTWLKKFFWIVATASVGSLVAGLINLMIQYN